MSSLTLMNCKQTYLGHLSQSTTFFPEVYNDATAAVLSLLDGLFDAENQVRPACADVGTKHVTSVALFASQSLKQY